MDSNLIFHIIEDLLLTEHGETCEGRGLTTIGSLTECLAKIETIQTYYPSVDVISEESDSDRPKGCYVLTEGARGEGYFNMHASGDSDSDSRALCIQGGRK